MRYNSLGKLVKDEDDLWDEVHALRDENRRLRKRIKELETENTSLRNSKNTYNDMLVESIKQLAKEKH